MAKPLPLLIDLMERRLLSHLALNGAGAIHDFEVALIGETSEKVAETIQDGRFGMVGETGAVFNRVCKAGAKADKGLGRALAEELAGGSYPSRESSLVYRAARAGATVTVHVSIGTDTVHAVPGVSGADVGAATYACASAAGPTARTRQRRKCAGGFRWRGRRGMAAQV